MNETVKTILDRRSVRSYTSSPLTVEQLDTLKSCAQMSPTAMNAQSWHFTFVTDISVIDKVEESFDRCVERTGDDALRQRMASRGGRVFYNAPLVVFISSDSTSDYGRIDAGIAAENLALAAQSMGLGSVIVGLVGMVFRSGESGEIKKLLRFPETHEFSIAVAIGNHNTSNPPHALLDNRITII